MNEKNTLYHFWNYMSVTSFLLEISVITLRLALFSHLRNITFIFLLMGCFGVLAQEYTIASYNVENLMDTLDNLHASDNEFLPNGKNKWNKERYELKLQRLATVISKLGDKDGPEILGLIEIENRKVLEDLVAEKELKNKNYQIVHQDSKDQRGIDVALIYKANHFKVLSWKTISASLEKIPTHTRDILLVKGVLAKDTIVVVVNHWPSRRMGKEKTEDKRITMALLVREAVDSIYQKEKRYPVVVMGDFNDEPFDKSVKEVLLSHPDWKTTDREGLMNPFAAKAQRGQGSYLYQKKWNMLDQILLGTGWRNGNWELTASEIYHPSWMHYQRNELLGPFKTYNSGQYKGGYSDHFPVYITLKVRNQ